MCCATVVPLKSKSVSVFNETVAVLIPLAKETLFPKITLELEFEVTVAPTPETLNPAKSKVPEIINDLPHFEEW